jgi:murein DD-endopeptidase MepM/ murein hydrolase activator NlpD
MRNSTIVYIWLISLVILGGITLYSNQTVHDAIISPLSDKIETLEARSRSQENTPQPTEISSNTEINDTPLEFIFPTPGIPPVSFWRPPLYEIPWALSPNDHFLFSRPIAANEVNWPLADYRYGYFFPDTDIVHTGIDIDAPRGTPILASAAGTVVWAGYGLYTGSYNEDDPYGIAVTIQHDFGWKDNRLLTVYAHMDRVDVKVGQEVHLGDQLGIIGDTGFTTGPHLHFEVRLAANSFFRTRNPELWLAPPQGWGVLVGQLRKKDYAYLNYQDVYVRKLDSNQQWMVRSYGPSSVNRDDYYQENLVLSDLPAGNHVLYFDYESERYRHSFSINPGEITFFTFQENIGIKTELPQSEELSQWENIIQTDNFSN